jgi:undecaprenyl-diphosphatase
VSALRPPTRWRDRPLALLAVATLLLGLLWAVASRVGGPLLEAVLAADRAILLAVAIEDPAAVTTTLVGEVMRDITALGGVTVIAGLVACVAVFLILIDRWRQALFLVTTVISGVIILALLKAGFDRPRPDVGPHGSHALMASFPSGHSSTAAVAYLTLALLLLPALGRSSVRVFVVTVAAVTTLAVGASRVYLGVHWPTDVLAGWLLGVGWALGAFLVERRLQRRGAIEPDAPPDDPHPHE